MSTPPNEPNLRKDPDEPKTPEPDTAAQREPEPEPAPRLEPEPAPAPHREAPSAPSSREPAAPAVPAGTAAGTGQHAAPRPYPPAPIGQAAPPPPGPGDAARTQAPGAQRPIGSPPSAAVPVAAAPPTHAESPDARPTDAAREEPVRDLPEPPTRPGMGRHLLAALLGLVLTPFALTLVGIGTGRLADIAGTTDMGTDLLGGTLLTLGVLMLAVIVLLGTWSAALPIVGGLVWAVGLGAAYLIVPSAMRDGAEAMTADGNVPVEVEQLANAGMNGSLLVIGALLVAAGLAVSLARRQGRRFAERVALADRARLDAEREGVVHRTR